MTTISLAILFFGVTVSVGLAFLELRSIRRSRRLCADDAVIIGGLMAFWPLLALLSAFEAVARCGGRRWVVLQERDAEAMAADWFGSMYDLWHMTAMTSEVCFQEAEARAKRLEKAARELVAEIGPCTCSDAWRLQIRFHNYDPMCRYHGVGDFAVEAMKDELGRDHGDGVHGDGVPGGSRFRQIASFLPPGD